MNDQILYCKDLVRRRDRDRYWCALLTAQPFKNDLFALLAVGGLLMLFGLQVLLNVSVTLGLVPTTGITFPFISYGGSSLLSISISMGIVLALTKKYSNKH